jgi:hypothetical protein
MMLVCEAAGLNGIELCQQMRKLIIVDSLQAQQMAGNALPAEQIAGRQMMELSTSLTGVMSESRARTSLTQTKTFINNKLNILSRRFDDTTGYRHPVQYHPPCTAWHSAVIGALSCSLEAAAGPPRSSAAA